VFLEDRGVEVCVAAETEVEDETRCLAVARVMLDQEGEGGNCSPGFLVGGSDEKALGKGQGAGAQSVNSGISHGSCAERSNERLDSSV